MNRAELIDAIAEDMECSKAEAGRFLEAFLDHTKKAMKKGEGLRLAGFGTLTHKKRKARTARNPQTGEEVRVPAKKVPAFKAGKELKDFVAAGK